MTSQIKDAEILSKWRKEAKESRPSSEVLISDRMFNCCILELENKAVHIDDPSDPPPAFVYNGDVYKSDTALSSSLKNDFKTLSLNLKPRYRKTRKTGIQTRTKRCGISFTRPCFQCLWKVAYSHW